MGGKSLCTASRARCFLRMHPHVRRRTSPAAAAARVDRRLAAADARRVLEQRDVAPLQRFADRDMTREILQHFREARRGKT